MDIKQLIRTIPDYPKAGIQFRDITSLLQDVEGFAFTIGELATLHKNRAIDIIAGIESRGFIFGGALALYMGLGFVPIRKKGKLPGDTFRIDYELEYGVDSLEIHKDALESGQKILVIDDLLATGGTAAAAIDLVRSTGAETMSASFVVELPDLGGRQVLIDKGIEVLSLCEFEGD